MRETWMNWNDGRLLPLNVWIPFVAIFCIIAWWDQKRQPDKLSSSFSRLRTTMIAYGIIVAYFMLQLPTSFIVDNSMGELARLETSSLPLDLMNHLKENNSALVRLLEIVYWFLLLTLFWFLTANYTFLSVIKQTTKALSDSSKKEEL